MRQATWQEMFRQPAPAPVAKRGRLQQLLVFSWEEAVTLAIVLVGFFLAVNSIDKADWVRLMPSLYPISFVGLGIGIALAKSRLPEWLAHLVALALGVGGTILASIAKLDGSIPHRIGDLADRVYLWTDALVTGGISNDNLPFVVLVVALCYVTAYVSAWSIFRWQNAWIGVVPGGIALLTNVSYLPGQSSFAVPVYLLCSILLVARLHLLRKVRAWREERAAYPDLISLYVLNVTGWLAIGLLVVAWLLPVQSGGGIVASAWEKATSPIASQLNGLSRVFAAIDGQRGGPVHKFGSTLPLQGEVSLGRSQVMEVTMDEPGFLRAQTYAEYTPQGWKTGDSRVTADNWPAARPIQDPAEAVLQVRRPVSIEVTTTKSAGVFVSSGSPIDVSVDSRVVFGAENADVTSIRPTERLDAGASYRVDSTVSAAAPERLRAAGTAYSDWLSPYLQLPGDLPDEVRQKAIEVTQGATNPYDQAVALEEFLRTYAVDTKIAPAPPKRDSVAYFLFDVQAGYFDYHASAMVVMLRTLGVPARLATGYITRLQDRIPDTDTYVVTEGSAFSWPEVYFPSLGWVEFNPTPGEARVTRATVNTPPPGLTDFNDLDLAGYLDDIGPVTTGTTSTELIDELSQDQGSQLVGNIIAGVIVAFLGITLVGGAAFQLVWQRGMAGLPYPAQIWEKTTRLARWARIPSQPQQTPAEFLDVLEHELPPVDDIGYIETAFVRSRYGKKELGEDEKERLTTAWRGVRKLLLRRVLRRR